MYKKILKEIKKYEKIIIFGHIRPDGDCIGSQNGLKEILRFNFPKKKILTVGEESEYINFLEPIDVIENDEEFKGALAIVVDCGNADRVSDQRFKLCDKVIKIDHHVAIEQYGDMNYVEEHTPACCQMITEFAMTNKLKLNDKSAFALYTGIVTDTGRFRFQGVGERTFKAASILTSFNVNVEKLDNLLSVETMNVIKFKGYVYENAQFTENGVVYIKVTRDIIEKFGLSDEDAAAQVSMLGTIENYPLYFLVIEYPTAIRLRIRSRAPRIDKLANKYSGGGHAKAAGGTIDSWDQLKDFVKDADDLIKYYKETGKDDLF